MIREFLVLVKFKSSDATIPKIVLEILLKNDLAENIFESISSFVKFL